MRLRFRQIALNGAGRNFDFPPTAIFCCQMVRRVFLKLDRCHFATKKHRHKHRFD